MDLAKGLRVIQVVLVLGAVLTGLSWFEGSGSAEVREVGGENLRVETAAPVEHPRGPWEHGTVFTDEHAGVPLDVAPRLNVTVDHRTDQVTADERTWNATLRFEATGEDGGTWWRHSRPLTIETQAGTAHLSLDLASTVQEARSMADEADVPSRLSITVEVRQQATVTVDGEPRPSRHTATVDLVPREGFVVVQTSGDGSTYSQPVEAGMDRTPFALLGAAVLAEGGVRLARRNDPPWEHVRGVRVVEVADLDVSADAHRVRFEALARVARDEGQTLFVDSSAGLAVLPGPPPLTAPLPRQR